MSNLVVRILAKDLTGAGFASASAQTRKLEAAVSRASQRMGRFGLIAAAGVGVAIYKFAQFDKKIAEIGTLLGKVTEKDIKRMSKEVRGLAITYGQSLDDMAKAKYDIISAGFTKAADSSKLLAQASKLAVAGVSEVGGTAKLLTKTLNAYGLSVEHAADVSDIMFTTVRLGQTTIEELVGSVGNVASIARSAGLKLKDLGSMMAALTAGGLDTQIAAVALRGALQALAAPTEQGIQGMKKYGIEIKRFADGTLDIVNTMKQFEGLNLEAIKDIIPDVRAANAVANVASNMGKLVYIVAEMEKRAGATGIAFDKMSARLDFKIKQMKAQLGSAMVEIGDKLSFVAEGLVGLVEWFSKLNAPMQVAIGTFGVLTVAIMAFATALTIALGPFGVLYAAAGALGIALIAMGVAAATADTETEKLGKTAETTASQLGKLQTRLEQLNEKQLGIRIKQLGWLMRGLTKDFEEGKIAPENYVTKLRDLKLELKAVQNQIKTLREGPKDTGDTGSDAPKIEQRITDWQVFYDSLEEKDKSAVDNWAMEQDRQMAMEAEYMQTRMEMDAILNNAGIESAEKKRIALLRLKIQERQDAERETKRQVEMEEIAAANRLSIIQDVLSRLAGSFGQHTAIAKAALIAQATMDTYAAANRAYAALFPPWNFIAAAAVTAAGLANVAKISGMSRGGFVEPVRAQTGMVSQGFDTQPAMLRPGEAVISTEHTRDNLPAIRQIMAGQSPSGSSGGGGDVTISPSFNIQAWDGNDVRRVVRSADFRNTIVDMIEDGLLKLNVNGSRVQGMR